MAGTAGTASRSDAASDVSLDREIEAVADVLQERGDMNRAELHVAVNARLWGPGRFRRALREAVQERRVKRVPGSRYGPGTPNRTA
jgi:hypothetical protein